MGVAVGVVVGAVGTAVTPWVKHIVPQPGRRKRALMRLERAMADHEHWIETANVEMAEELQRIDDDLAGRGVLNSGIRMQEHQRVRDRYKSEQAQRFRQVLRVAHDARDEMGPIERWRTKRRLGKENPSLEEQIFGEPEV